MNPVFPLKAWPRSDTCADVDSVVTDLYHATGAARCNWA